MSINIRKKNYTSKAIAIFKQDGLRLSLEEVAGKMGMTKKTLYNHFSSKDELLKECIRYISYDFQEALSVLDSKEYPAIQNLRKGFMQINSLFTELSPMFFYDLMRLNPNQATSEHLIGSGLFKQKMEANLKLGIESGIYRSDLDVEFISHYLSYSIFGYYINTIINNNPLITKNYFGDIVEYNLRAIVSEKGKNLL